MGLGAETASILGVAHGASLVDYGTFYLCYPVLAVTSPRSDLRLHCFVQGRCNSETLDIEQACVADRSHSISGINRLGWTTSLAMCHKWLESCYSLLDFPLSKRKALEGGL